MDKPRTLAADRPRRSAARSEAGRKAVHVAVSVVAACLVLLLSQGAARLLFALTTAVALVIDLARLRSAAFRRPFLRAFSAMLRDEELDRLTGATMLSVGFTLAVCLLPSDYAAAGLFTAGLADPAAAFVGRGYGRVRLPGGKSLEGAAAFLLVAFVVGVSTTSVGLAGAAIAAAITAMLEAISPRFDDNLYLPIMAGTLLWILAP